MGSERVRQAFGLFSSQKTGYEPLNIEKRGFGPRWWILGVLTAASLALFAEFHAGSERWSRMWQEDRFETRLEECPSFAFDAGSWQRKAEYLESVNNEEDWHKATGIEACPPITRHWGGHDPAPTEMALSFSYEWEPHPRCRLNRPSIKEKLQSLVDGGLLLIGDSLSYQHFIAVGCELGTHVSWKGIDRRDPGSDREDVQWEQQLLVNPESPIVKEMGLVGVTRPLVIWSWLATPGSREELRDLPGFHREYMPDAYGPRGPDLAENRYTISRNVSAHQFANRSLNLRTAVLSLGAHFTRESAFWGSSGGPDLAHIWRLTMTDYVDWLLLRMRTDQRLLVRATAPGHDPNDHAGPLSEMGAAPSLYSWNMLPIYNTIMRNFISMHRDRRLQWIGLERQARLRPDAHPIDDSLHYRIGTGVYEVYTQYIWHLIT